MEGIIEDKSDNTCEVLDMAIIEEDLKHILNKKQYIVFKQCILDGYSKKETAMKLGVSVQRVYKIIDEIRIKCRDYFYDNGKEKDRFKEYNYALQK